MTQLIKRPPGTVTTGGVAARQIEQNDPRQYLTFTLGGETFAIAILGVKEIIGYPPLTDVPMMSDCIRGVINLRGSVVTVMDLSVRFGRRPTQVTRRTCIVIVEIQEQDERQVVGVVVDAVNAVVEIAASAIEPPPAFGARIRNDYIEGMAKVNEKFVILLDISRVFTGLDLEVMESRDGAAANAGAGGSPGDAPHALALPG